MKPIRSIARTASIALIAALVTACGGGGSNSQAAPDPQGSEWVAGQFLPQATFFARCAVPRTELNPATGQPVFPDIQGSILDENNWLRSWINDSYLWYDEVLDQAPALFSDPAAYFDELRTTELTDTGNLKDRFHFALNTAQWLAESQSGIRVGYGMEFQIRNAVPPRDVIVTYTQPATAATANGIARGARITGVDGADLINGDTQEIVDIINAGLFPEVPGEQHSFEILDPGAAAPRSIAMTAAEVTAAPVQNISTLTSPSGASVGYLHFSEHIATAEPALIDAVSQFAAVDIEDLVIDLRYNGGGFLSIASQLAYMIAGNAQTKGRAFELLEFNDKYPATNPVTGAALTPQLFRSETSGISNLPAGQPLPSLDLDRVFVITGSNTCSASESIINSLRGVGVEVIQIGERTCGKPYGFYPTDNCGTTWFSIQFRGVNESGFGDYADGFVPAVGGAFGNTQLPGCIVTDDFSHSLGSVNEARLAAALQFRDTGTCPVVTATATTAAGTTAGPAIGQAESVFRNNRILQPD